MPGQNSSQRILFGAWAAAVGLRVLSDVQGKKDWPCPGPPIKITALYLMLGVLSLYRPAENLSAMLGVGFLLVFITRQGVREIPARGTFFGIKVSSATVAAARAAGR